QGNIAMDTFCTGGTATAGMQGEGPEQRVRVMEKCSVYADCEQEVARFKWIESERAGRDLAEIAIRRWVPQHCCCYLRARCVEHLQGQRFWLDLDHNHFRLLQHEFGEDPLLLDPILDRLKAGQENLDIILWALDCGMDIGRVIRILEVLDVNSRRLSHRFDPIP